MTILFLSLKAAAQIDDNSLPFSFRNPEIEKTLSKISNPAVILTSPNIEALKNEDEQSTLSGMPNRIGVNLKVDLDLA